MLRSSLTFILLAATLPLLAQRSPDSESVRQPDSRHLRTAVTKLLGWKITATGDPAKVDAANLAFIEVSNPTPDPSALKKLNLHVSAYRVDSVVGGEEAFRSAKSLGADTIITSQAPTSISELDKLASDAGINVAITAASGSKGDLKTLLTSITDASNRIGVSVNSDALPKNALESVPGLKERLMVLNVRGASRLSDLLLDISRAEPAPEEQPEKCSNCGRPYGGTKPLVVTLDKTDAASLEAFEKALRPAMGYRVEQITKVLPITSTDRVPAEDKAKIEAALPREAPVKPKKPRKLLVIDLSPAGGYYHATVAHANFALGLMAKTGAYEPTFSNDLNNLKWPKIRQYDAVFLNSVVGEVFPDPDVLNGLIRFVKEGGGVAGIHGSTYASMDLPEYGELMGAQDGPHHVEKATVKIDDPNSPVAKSFEGKEFEWTDEFYHFLPTGPLSRDKVHVLLSIDTAKSDMSRWKGIRPDNDYPVSWIKTYGKGHVFNCALGHTPMLFETPAFATYILSAIQYVLGDLPADATPSAKLSASR